MASAPSLFDGLAVLLTLTAVFGWLNLRFLRLPQSIALLTTGLIVSGVVLVGRQVAPEFAGFTTGLVAALDRLDFSRAVLDGVLAFILFAGALQIDFDELRDRLLPIGILATVGTLISTAMVTGLFWGAARLLDFPLPAAWALVFAALISPTDPVAVMATLRGSKLPKRVAMVMEGESLFNDGVGVVLFLAFLATATGAEAPDPLSIGGGVLLESLGGIVLGAAAGWLTYRAMRLVDEYVVEVMLSLALVTGTYALAQHIHVSGPIAMVVAGLVIGNRGMARGMSEQTRHYVGAFWLLVGEILNALLFLLIGLEVLVLDLDFNHLLLALLAIPIALFARFAAVATPMLATAWRKGVRLAPVTLLTWGGVRGGISIALALSIRSPDYRDTILTATYAVVLFTVVLLGLTIGPVTRRLYPGQRALDGGPDGA
ncbi:sodium/proton antiporter, CPA1 family [Tistlia consotensis]|uniref:Sodium/proton antiporter, CPA1 family n=1 Tax=Tistlia consotensis USBA 355 TaxID=560819 RepID=A0A1Y6BWF6_9PROT|nr:sodium:proton antiporter [Tistlia consotensis]SMF21837.1 sodium/proton antiporter, CPA1 family [Tistlia consotensis USBA 355]SNR46519.1 sodium/proton antiporter, CPA1 family [Tistlia consotensis]